MEESVLTVGKFHNVVKLVAFSPFKSAQSALENMNAVSEGERGARLPPTPPLPTPPLPTPPFTAPCGSRPAPLSAPPRLAGILHEDLRLLLETSMPAKKKKALLGVGDAKIGAAILEELGYQCQTGGVVAEILRGEPGCGVGGGCWEQGWGWGWGLWAGLGLGLGLWAGPGSVTARPPAGIRLHFHALVKGLTAQSASKAQLGLGHSYSRAKVKFNVNRVDNMIIQSISLLDQLDKDINTFSMRVRSVGSQAGLREGGCGALPTLTAGGCASNRPHRTGRESTASVTPRPGRRCCGRIVTGGTRRAGGVGSVWGRCVCTDAVLQGVVRVSLPRAD